MRKPKPHDVIPNRPPASVSVLAFGAVGDGRQDDAPAIQAALDSGAVHVHVPGGTFCLRSALYPHEGQCLEIDGTLKIADATRQRLMRDVAVGATSVTVEDGSAFYPGQWVVVHDDRLPVQGGGRQVRRQCAGSAQIQSIDGNRLIFAVQSAKAFLRDANGRVATLHSAIMVHHSRIHICGCGTIDGNKRNQFDTAPGQFEREKGMEVIGSGISVAAFPRRLEQVVIEGLTIIDPVLHGIQMKDCDRSVIRQTVCLRAHDKNICLQRVRDCAVLHNYACDSEFEDGIQFHQKADPEHWSHRVKVEGNLCTGNARTGIGIGAGMHDFFLSHNLCADNGKNISLRGTRIVSDNDVALGCNDRVFAFSGQRASIQADGRSITLRNPTVLGSPSTALGIGGVDIRVEGGTFGDMSHVQDDYDGVGIDLVQGNRASGEPRRAAHKVVLRGTTVRGCRQALRIHPAARALRFEDNDFGDTAAPDAIPATVWPELQLRNNQGLRTHSSGLVTLPGTQTRVCVPHGLCRLPAPGGITVTPHGCPGDTGRFWVEAISAVSFDIVLDRAPGGDGARFGWQANADA